MQFQLLWFDSLGAKSVATLVKTPDVSILIDPGAAVMQPSFPATSVQKAKWKAKATKKIIKASKKADIIILTHYHYDHYFPRRMDLYEGKTLLVKSPNEYINDSQRDRSQTFFQRICKEFGKEELKEKLRERKEKEYPDPLSNLPLAREKDFGDYHERREELLEKWRERFYRRVENWHEVKWIPPMDLGDVDIRFADGNTYQFGNTRIRFSRPLFHGIEYSRVGWVIAPVITYNGEKIIHSSDLNGVYIEDYAKWLWEEDPHVLILDGPPTYMLGYMLNKINLRRCVRNTCKILKRTSNLDLMIYDHHLLREKKYKKRTKKVWETGKHEDVQVVTSAGYKGKTPVIEKC